MITNRGTISTLVNTIKEMDEISDSLKFLGYTYVSTRNIRGMPKTITMYRRYKEFTINQTNCAVPFVSNKVFMQIALIDIRRIK